MSLLRSQTVQREPCNPTVGGTAVYDSMDDFGEGAYYLDEENRIDNNIDEHPTDVLIDELEEVD